jgi:hypothetical protein
MIAAVRRAAVRGNTKEKLGALGAIAVRIRETDIVGADRARPSRADCRTDAFALGHNASTFTAYNHELGCLCVPIGVAAAIG